MQDLSVAADIRIVGFEFVPSGVYCLSVENVYCSSPGHDAKLQQMMRLQFGVLRFWESGTPFSYH